MMNFKQIPISYLVIASLIASLISGCADRENQTNPIV